MAFNIHSPGVPKSFDAVGFGEVFAATIGAANRLCIKAFTETAPSPRKSFAATLGDVNPKIVAGKNFLTTSLEYVETRLIISPFPSDIDLSDGNPAFGEILVGDGQFLLVCEDAAGTSALLNLKTGRLNDQINGPRVIAKRWSIVCVRGGDEHELVSFPW